MQSEMADFAPALPSGELSDTYVFLILPIRSIV